MLATDETLPDLHDNIVPLCKFDPYESVVYRTVEEAMMI